MSLGQVVSDARKKARLSQKELAAAIVKEDGEPMSPQYLNDIEHDRRTPTSDHLIGEFARVLGIPKEVLYYEAGQLPEDTRGANVGEERVLAAYKAFRRTLQGK